MKNDIYKLIFWILALACVIAYARLAYGELTSDRPTDENIGICGNHCWYDMRGKNLKEWKLEEHLPEVKQMIPVVKKEVIPASRKNPIVKELPKETDHIEDKHEMVDLDKLAKAVAMAETTGCTKGTALSRKNCHGIKSGNTYPCKNPKGAMCTFDTHEESYKAFKVIWGKWYKTFPTRKMAERWTGADNADRWLAHVKLYYYQ